ncbi:hypothetical protein FG87_19330 [Nocardia vulneris]|uniref:Uncharacterized protein n=1 Tax=Nocardia vulneris TaxID=1141657 RepID=A0ABR4ZE10_9NOCA|nr:hypothetical protein FG87_19330 [Nocardia vulneris]
MADASDRGRTPQFGSGATRFGARAERRSARTEGVGASAGTWFGTSEGLLDPNWVGRLGGTGYRKALRRKPCARG